MSSKKVVAMLKDIKTLLDSFGLVDKVIACLKDKGLNLNLLTYSYNSNISF
jgi:hypothetical protein